MDKADKTAQSTVFIEFMLTVVRDAITEALPKKSSEESSEKSSEKILTLLRRFPTLTAKAIAEKLSLSPRAVEKQIANLKKEGRLTRIGSPKGGYWEVL